MVLDKISLQLASISDKLDSIQSKEKSNNVRKRDRKRANKMILKQESREKVVHSEPSDNMVTKRKEE